MGARSCSNRNHLHIRAWRLACLAALRMRVKWELRCRRRLHAACRASTEAGLRAMRVASGRILGPWGSSWEMAMRIGARGAESSSSGRVLETWAAWCGGGSRRRASSSPEAEPGIGVRTCWCCRGRRRAVTVVVWSRNGGDSREKELRPVPAHR